MAKTYFLGLIEEKEQEYMYCIYNMYLQMDYDSVIAMKIMPAAPWDA